MPIFTEGIPKLTVDIAWLKGEFPGLTHLTELGSGGQKWVFSAIHSKDGDVVLKVIKPTESLESTEREVLAVLKVDSHRVPKILEVGTIVTQVGPCVWVREQRVIGQPLRQLLSTTGPLKPEMIVKLVLQLLEAIAKAEEVNIVHRDIKPENIILDLKGDFWLLDFGIARHLQLESETPSGAVFGKMTWGYAPPEQCRNFKRDIDARADLFALGVTAYECATGQNPFTDGARDALEVLKRIETISLPPLDLPIAKGEVFRDLVGALTRKRRDHRPRTARDALAWAREVTG